MDVKCFKVQAPGEKIHAKVFNVLSLLGLDNLMRHARCAISFGREPKGGLVRVFNLKFGSVASQEHKFLVHMQPLLDLKTQSRFHPIN
jgi:hypothetical protein